MELTELQKEFLHRLRHWEPEKITIGVEGTHERYKRLLSPQEYQEVLSIRNADLREEFINDPESWAKIGPYIQG